MTLQSGNQCGEYVNSVLRTFKFTVAILLPKYPRLLFSLCFALYVAKLQRREKKMRLKLQVVPEDGFEYLIPRNIRSSVLGNNDSIILVSFNTLKNVGVSSLSWVKLCKVEKYSPFSVRTKSYLVKIIAVPNVDDFLAIVTNVLHHNVSHTLLLMDDTVSIQKEGGFESFIPYLAKSASVSLVQSTHDGLSVDTVLSTYFQQPRFLRVGDVFSINTVKHTPSVFYSSNKATILYFKVLEVEGPPYEKVQQQDAELGYYITKGFTCLTQSSDQQDYIPRNDIIFISNKANLSREEFKLQLLSSCPDGLNGYRDELLECVQTFVPTINRCHLKPLFLLYGPRGVGKGDVIRNVAGRLGLHILIANSYELQGESPGYSEGRLKFIFTKARHCAPCILLLRNIDVLCKDSNGDDDNRIISSFTNEVQELYQEARKFPVIIVATCDSKNESTSAIAPALARLFLHVIHMQGPSDVQRSAILQWLLRKSGVTTSAELSHIAAQTSSFLYTDLAALVSHAVRNRYKCLKEKYPDELSCHDISLSKMDFEVSLDVIHTSYADAIDAPKVPKVSWNDVGGLSDLKEEIIRTVTLPLEHPELLAAGLRRSGILLYGPPGTGKTLLAKAVATECNLNFLSVKGPELLNMYVGQSEENVREVFSRARASSPCVIFFDELDSLAPNRGRSGDSGGVMDRVVSQLLAELDGLQKSTHLFVIGATNRPDLIDPALLRPGRFDKLLYVGVSTDKESKLSILVALTRRFQLSSDVELESVVSLLPDNLTGADLYSVCSRAWLSAVRTKICNLKCDDSSLSPTIEVEMQDFRTAINNLVPSVSVEDLAYFQQIKKRL
ncbi:peroxisomal ATPase PEX6 [Periplaneta americana]|uniref:peroxisomal ATPase PEX6 n=1 Tax=Periplaneta americana TaxID=6978 RepID=UPI0037E9402F